MGSSSLRNLGSLHGEVALSLGLRTSRMPIILEQKHSLQEKENRGSQASESLTSLAESKWSVCMDHGACQKLHDC